MRAGSILYCIAAVLAASCTKINETDYSSFAKVPEEGMPQGWEFVFNPTQSDSAEVISGRHDVVVVARYTKECRSSSVLLDVEEISLRDQNPATSRVEIKLFDEAGRPLGKGIYGVYEVADTLRRNVSVADGYSVAVSSPLPDSLTRGMKALGIVLPRTQVSGR